MVSGPEILLVTALLLKQVLKDRRNIVQYSTRTSFQRKSANKSLSDKVYQTILIYYCIIHTVPVLYCVYYRSSE